MIRTLVAFARPHTIGGTILAVLVLYLLAASTARQQSLAALTLVMIASLAVNVYIVGLNQLTDIAIDRINKPWLPLASGELSIPAGRWIVLASAIVALVVAALQGPVLFATIAAIAAIGTAYSLPPLRLKRYPFWATSAITLARGCIANIGVYNAYALALGAPMGLPPNLLAFVTFLFVFVTVIGLMKDVPDQEGDQAHGIQTLAVRFGAGPTMNLCLGLLALAYGGMLVAGLTGHSGMQPVVVVCGHGLGLGIIVAMWTRMDLSQRASAQGIYKRVWQLFYLEFAIVALGSLLA